MRELRFWPANPDVIRAQEIGFRLGDKGTHTSRTMMLDELTAALGATQAEATRDDYAQAAIDGNCFGKTTVATRRLTNQRLGELYGLDPQLPMFRVLRRLWETDVDGRPLLAVLAAMARDPLLLATAPSVLSLRSDAEFRRDEMKASLRRLVGERLNESILDKVVRNAASSWAQSGHMRGRTFKRRQNVVATPGATAMALFLADAVGFRGAEVLSSGWIAALDASPTRAQELALAAKRAGHIDLRVAGDVFELSLDRLDPWTRRM